MHGHYARSLLLAALALFATTGAAHAADAAGRFHAGETARETKTDSAALRNHGDAALRMLVWYPAPETAAEAPLADAAQHPVVLL